MEDPKVLLVPDVSFHGSPGEGYRAQVGPETLYVAKWFPGVPCRCWSVSPYSHRVVGLIGGVIWSRIAGKNRQLVGARQ